ncbi:helix-turn-helix domain-containing protein [Streptomyces sp. NPDC096057]|uniref:ATP-binding protein n=1 Tax=Streptomyces sp. NPDC096057 TaxID=3155543 RepID=UPI003324A5DA
MSDRETFGRLLREARQQALLTLEALAAASGVSVRAISDMERGRSLPRQATMSDLLNALEPTEEQRRRLVQAATGHVRRVPQQLPPDLAVFRGRAEAMRTVRALTSQVADHGGPVVVSAIGGMAGVGKTALAVHWAHQVADRFPDGQLYVNLRGFEEYERPLDPGEALGGFLAALGVPGSEIPADTPERSALFRQRTASRRLIVVLDNARTEDQVRPLLTSAPGCLTIVTSRNRLSGLAVAEGSNLVGLDVWDENDALAALAARIGEERCRSEPEAAAGLVRLCGYLPLAVAVVGAQLSAAPEMHLRIALQELREARLDVLSTGDTRADVRTVFSWSYHALTDMTARFFRLLALHPGPSASAEAAASLAGVDMASARRHLRELATASLVSRDALGQHVLHDLVRAYGVELVDQCGDDRLAAEGRLLDYLRHNAYAAGLFVSRLKSDPPGPLSEGVVRVRVEDRDEALDWYRREAAATATVLRRIEEPRLLRRRVDLALEWVGYNVVAGRWAEEITAGHIALEAALTLDDPVAIVQSCANLVRALVETGRHGEADEPAAMMMRHMHRLPPARQVRAEGSLNRLRFEQKRPHEGLQHARNALALCRTHDLQDGLPVALVGLGAVLDEVGDHVGAIALAEEALPLLRAAGNRRTEGVALANIGQARQNLGDLSAAIGDYERALRLYEAVLDTYGQAEVWDQIASVRLRQGAVEEARVGWTRSADLFSGLRVARADRIRAKLDGLPQPQDPSAAHDGR